MTQLQLFRKHFPSTNLRLVTDEQLRYRYRTVTLARTVEAFAQTFIIARGIAVTAHLEIIERGGMIVEIAVVIQPVPEEYDFADEAQDNEIYHEEKAEWV